jgi:hypothetical protein
VNESASSPQEVEAKVLEMMKAGVSEETIASYLRGAKLSRSLNAEEILDWKKAGIAEGVIRVALGR